MNPSLYKSLIRPILFRLDSEQAHLLIHRLAGQCRPLLTVAGAAWQYRGDDLQCDLFGHKLSNPIGLAAGFDKNADLVELLGHVGFGYAEVGSVTALAKEGNPKPRLFRLPKDRALINRLGLNGAGADRVAAQLERCNFSIPIGLNIAKTNDPAITGDAAVEDILYTFKKIRDLPLSYVTINGSCPNTKEGIVTEAAHMRTLFTQVQKLNTRQLPILVKLSPDSSQDLLQEMVEAASECGLSGYVCGNTSTSRENLATDEATLKAIGNGGMSGPPLKSKALRICQIVNQLKNPSQIIIACGGVSCGADAYEFLVAGASFVQLYTALVYEGPGLPLMICRELSSILRRNGQTLEQAIGWKQKSSAIG